MGYKGQHENKSLRRTSYDGAEQFTESIRRRASLALRGQAKDDNEIGGILVRLATQTPYPSFQAQRLLEQFRESNIYYPHPGYDEMVARAWEIDAAGFPNLARLALAEEGISYEFQGS